LAYDDLRDWIKALERAGELKRIGTEADPILEIAEITDRVSKSETAAGRSARPTQRIKSNCSGKECPARTPSVYRTDSPIHSRYAALPSSTPISMHSGTW
jgi:UbiD family decarboxylase